MKTDFPYIHTTTPMTAYFGQPDLKTEFVQRMLDHIDADEVIQGSGFVNGRGCAVGCTYDEYDHSLGPERLGFPEWYERARDAIFERLPIASAKHWALASLQEVRVGVDLNGILPKFLLKVQFRNFDRIDGDDEHAANAREFIKRVIAYIALGEAPDNFESAVIRNTSAPYSRNQQYISHAVASAVASWRALNASSGYGASVFTSSAIYSAINSAESKAAKGPGTSGIALARHAEAATMRDDLIDLIHGAPMPKE